VPSQVAESAAQENGEDRLKDEDINHSDDDLTSISMQLIYLFFRNTAIPRADHCEVLTDLCLNHQRPAMKRPTKSLLFVAAGLSIFGSTGCQRSMNGSMATGPFAPAGSMAPTSSAPLIPIGPVNGATRVPPPSTGSSSPNSAYLSTPTTSSIDNRSVNTLQANAGNVSPNFGNAGLPPATFRDSLGGMPINDLTYQSTINQSVPASYSDPYQTTAVGSGLNQQYAAAPTSLSAQQPSDLLRSIETPSNAVPVPRYRGMESYEQAYNPAVQPVPGFTTTDSWQTTQPVNPPSTVGQPAIRQTSTASSTGPISNGQSAVQTASPSLPWRSPTTAR